MYSAQISEVRWSGDKLLMDVNFKPDDNSHPSFKDTLDITGKTYADVEKMLCDRVTHYEGHDALLVSVKAKIKTGEKIRPTCEPLAPTEPPASEPATEHAGELHSDAELHGEETH